MTIETFTGGIFDTNCYFLPAAGILIDAPQESAEWLRRQGFQVRLLLLTHGHIDHAWDAAEIQRDHPECRLACHPDTVPLVTERDFFRRFGLNWEIEPVRVDELLEETPRQTLGGLEFQILLVPGHCPGSLCFDLPAEQTLFTGDTLFAGSIGRTDLPGGDHQLLLDGIRGKLFTLPDPRTVLAGHGPATTLAIERKTNPYLA